MLHASYRFNCCSFKCGSCCIILIVCRCSVQNKRGVLNSSIDPGCWRQWQSLLYQAAVSQISIAYIDKLIKGRKVRVVFTYLLRRRKPFIYKVKHLPCFHQLLHISDFLNALTNTLNSGCVKIILAY